MVIDQDRHEGGPDGVSEWERQCTDNGLDEAGCLIVETPSGRHTYFLQGPGQTLRNSAGKIAEGIDTRAFGGYVIAPGAILPDGRQYRILSGSFSSCPTVPVSLHAFLAAKPQAASPTAPVRQSDPIVSLNLDSPLGPRESAYAAKALLEEYQKVLLAPNGKRNSTFNEAVFSIATMIPHYGLTVEDAAKLRVAARQAGLDDGEIERTF